MDERLGQEELNLLYMFRKPRYLDAPIWQDLWGGKLGKPYMSVIETLLEKGYLTAEAGDPERISLGSSVDDLKSVLRFEGLAVSGTKMQLIQRIITYLPNHADALLERSPNVVSVQGQGDGLLNSVRVSCFCPLSCGKSDTKPLAVGIVSWH